MEGIAGELVAPGECVKPDEIQSKIDRNPVDVYDVCNRCRSLIDLNGGFHTNNINGFRTVRWVLEGSKLMLVPPVGMTEVELNAATVEAPQLQTLIEIRGTAGAPVVGVSFSGFNLTGSAQTFLESYEAPSGANWSVHRGAAVFVQGAENISLSGMRFDQLEGNGVFFSNHVKHSEVIDSDFWRTGDSAVVRF